MTTSERIADRLASLIGSWTFIVVQSTILFLWITANGMGIVHWDEYPFILLNLLLSFQAAYTGPVLLMSANRQSDIDRKRAIKNLTIDEQEYQLMVALQVHLDGHFHKLREELIFSGVITDKEMTKLKLPKAKL